MSTIVPFKIPGNTGVSPEVAAAFRRWLEARFHWQDKSFVDFAERYVLTGSLDNPPTVFWKTDNAIRKVGHEEGAAFFKINTITDVDFYLRLNRIDWVAHRSIPEQAKMIPARLGNDMKWMAVHHLQSIVQGVVLRTGIALCDVRQPDASVFSAASEAERNDRNAMLKHLFCHQKGRPAWRGNDYQALWKGFLFQLNGLGDLILAQWDFLESVLHGQSGDHLLDKPKLIYALGRLGLGTGAKRDVFLPCLVGSGDANRAAARAALPWCDRAVVWAFVTDALTTGRPVERAEAADLLWSLDEEAALPLLEARLAQEKHAAVRDVVADLLGLEEEDIETQDEPVGAQDVASDIAPEDQKRFHRFMAERLIGFDKDFIDFACRYVLRGDVSFPPPIYRGLREHQARDLAPIRAFFCGNGIRDPRVHVRLVKVLWLTAQYPSPREAHPSQWLVQTLEGKECFQDDRSDPFDRLTSLMKIADAQALTQPDASVLYQALRLSGRSAAKSLSYLLDLPMIGALSGLDQVPDALPRIEKLLKGSSGEKRTQAVQCLARSSWPEAVPLLTAALKAERSQSIRGTIQLALKQRGQDDSGDSFGLAAQEDNAARLLSRKDALKPLDWFPWDSLPALRRADGQGTVPLPVVQSWLVMALRAKTLDDRAVLRQQVGVAQPEDRPALARAILAAWLACDREDDTALDDYAKKSREHYNAMMERRCLGSLTAAQAMQKIRANMMTPEPIAPMRPVGVASPCRGILGIAAVCGDESLVPLVRPALKAWDGSKRHHIIAVLEMLAAIDHPAAIQAVLAFATRHPARTVRESAKSLVQAIATAKGWTVEELADRTVPTGGLEDDGTLTLEFGPRAFTVTLADDLSLVLRDGDAKVLKSLPEPRQSDDADQAAAAKSAFASVKKELKALLPQQTARLYEAMCLEKSWSSDDWQRYIAGHPILGRMAQRLVWCDAGTGVLFRPLADSTLTDADDTAVTLPADARVRLAHAATAGPDASAAWVRHFADYEVKPLFSQFGRPVPELTAGQSGFADAVGVMLTSLKLRGIVTKLGYERGPSQDAGWYHNFVRAYPSLGLQASLMFTGCGHGGEDRPVALKEAGFLRAGDAYPRAENYLPLDAVPRPLAAELYADLMTAAAAGRFDPDWAAKSAP